MRNEYKKLERDLYEPRLRFKELLPWTGAGALGGMLATSFQLAGYVRLPVLEGIVRFVSGAGDSVAESIYIGFREIPKYFRRAENKGGPVVYYVGGKIIGALLSWLPDYLMRQFGVDVHSPFLGSIVPVAYAQLDQVGAYFGGLVYHVKRLGLRRGFKESLKDPTSQTSLIITGLSGAVVSVDGTIRTILLPTNFLYDWLETWLSGSLCLLPVWRGSRAEKKQENSK